MFPREIEAAVLKRAAWQHLDDGIYEKTFDDIAQMPNVDRATCPQRQRFDRDDGVDETRGLTWGDPMRRAAAIDGDAIEAVVVGVVPGACSATN